MLNLGSLSSTFNAIRGLLGTFGMKNIIMGDGVPFIVAFDSVLGTTDTHSQTVTHRPVEEGFEAFDAIHQNPPTLQISIIIVEKPKTTLDIGVVSNAASNITGYSIVNSSVARQIGLLELMFEQKETVSLMTKYRTYSGYYIEERSYDETEMEGVVVTMSLIKKRTNSVSTIMGKLSDTIGIFK